MYSERTNIPAHLTALDWARGLKALEAVLLRLSLEAWYRAGITEWSGKRVLRVWLAYTWCTEGCQITHFDRNGRDGRERVLRSQACLGLG